MSWHEWHSLRKSELDQVIAVFLNPALLAYALGRYQYIVVDEHSLHARVPAAGLCCALCSQRGRRYQGSSLSLCGRIVARDWTTR